MSPLLSSVASHVGIKRDKGESLHKTKTKTNTKTNTKTKTKTVWKFFMFCSSSATKKYKNAPFLQKNRNKLKKPVQLVVFPVFIL